MTIQALFNFALKTFLLLSPVFLFGDYQTSFTRGLFFLFGSFALFGISLALKPKRKFFSPWLALLLLWAIVRIFFNENLGDPTSEWFNFWISSAGFIYVLAGVLLFHTVYCHAGDLKGYFGAILIVSVMNFVLVIAQLIGHDFLWWHAPSICGFFGISSQLGQYSAMSIPILAFMNPWLAIIPIFTLFAARSISSIVAAFTGLGLYFWFRSPNSAAYKRARILPIGILIFMALSLGFFNWNYIAQKWRCRPIMWKMTLKSILQRPYLGHGYQSFTKAVVEPGEKASVGGQEFSRPHNDPLHTTQELGFPITVFVGGFFLSLWRKFRAKRDKDRLTYFLATAIIVTLVNGCGQTLIRYASMAGTFIVLLAFLHIKIQGEQDG